MAYPQIEVASSAVKRIQHFDCWVFRDELRPPREPIPNGEIVELIDSHNVFLAYAFYNAQAHIGARVISTNRAQPVDRTLLSHRINAALARRNSILHTNAKRLIFSEADSLPGLIVDQYVDILVLQIRAAGMERWKSTVIELLQHAVHPRGILERSDKEFRNEEGLPLISQVLTGTVPDRIIMEEDGLQFIVDPYHGHKTGFYLDQRETRRAVRARITPGTRVLDICAYTGAFGIGAASQGAQVVCIEQEEACAELLQENARLNHVEDRVDIVTGDAFYWLEAKAKGRERFDWVLLDPPGLVKNKADVLKGRRALHHLLIHALALLSEDGTLVLSVCTYHLLGLAEEIVRIAAEERGLCLRVIGLTTQAPDHPWILQIPMTRYLMSWMVQRAG